MVIALIGADRRMDMTKLIIGFRSLVNARENSILARSGNRIKHVSSVQSITLSLTLYCMSSSGSVTGGLHAEWVYGENMQLVIENTDRSSSDRWSLRMRWKVRNDPHD